MPFASSPKGLWNTTEIVIERGFYCAYDPFTRLDVRCELRIPGGVVGDGPELMLNGQALNFTPTNLIPSPLTLWLSSTTQCPPHLTLQPLLCRKVCGALDPEGIIHGVPPQVWDVWG